MRYELKNNNISICVDSHGAELKSLKRLDTGTEYMWGADPKYWGRTSPVLFPFVGAVKDNRFRTKGKTYEMGQHGFARDMEFTLEEKTEEEIWLTLSSNEETLEKYPYEFVLKLGYRLLENGVEVIWRVENPAEEALPFSVGGHPAFNCPIDEGKRQTDYKLLFDTKETVVSTRLSGGLASNEKDIFRLQDGYLAITEDLFDKDALVIEKNQAKQVSLCREDGAPYLTVRMEAPLFGIWSPPKKEAPFICIEPWYGRCDSVDFDGELTEREWGNVAAPGESFQVCYQIVV